MPVSMTSGDGRLTGYELRRQRRRLDIPQRAVAIRMGIVRSAVSHLEARSLVTPASAARYLDALAAEIAER